MTPVIDTEKLNEHSISMRIYHNRGEVLVAACDRSILGKNFEEGDFHIEVSKKFYFDAYVTDLTFLNSLKIATIANLVGKHVVNIALREGYISEGNIIEIRGIPHAQMVII